MCNRSTGDRSNSAQYQRLADFHRCKPHNMRECSFPKPFLQELAQFDYLNALGAGEVEVEAVVGTTDDPVDNGSGSNVLRLADLHVGIL